MLGTHVSGRNAVGGWRVLSHRLDDRGQATVTAIEVFAEQWDCTFVAHDDHLDYVDMRWSDTSLPAWGYPTNNETLESWIPSASVPLPMSGLSVSEKQNSVRIGGWSTAAAMADWQRTRAATPSPVLCGPFGNCTGNSAKISAIVRQLHTLNVRELNYLLWDELLITSAGLMRDRRNLSLSYTVYEDELRNGSYAFGMDWVIGYQMAQPPLFAYDYLGHNEGRPAALSAHPQAWSLAGTPQEGSDWLPQAASSLNTTRGLFRFRLRRVDHSMSNALRRRGTGAIGAPAALLQDTVTQISGGHSGSAFFSDWMDVNDLRCLLPDDPSYFQEMGAVVIRDNSKSTVLMQYASLPVSATLVIGCADGFHLEPPSPNREVEVTCSGDGMWVDLQTMAVQRCLRPQLNCTAPRVDTGYGECGAPPPRLLRIAVQDFSINKDGITITDLQYVPDPQLLVTGAWLLPPFRVLVGGEQCTEPTPRPNAATVSLCDQQGRGCLNYYTELTCTLPLVFGVSVVVTVESPSCSYDSRRAESNPHHCSARHHLRQQRRLQARWTVSPDRLSCPHSFPGASVRSWWLHLSVPCRLHWLRWSAPQFPAVYLPRHDATNLANQSLSQ
jgi:hypothetical protein